MQIDTKTSCRPTDSFVATSRDYLPIEFVDIPSVSALEDYLPIALDATHSRDYTSADIFILGASLCISENIWSAVSIGSSDSLRRKNVICSSASFVTVHFCSLSIADLCKMSHG